MKKVLLLLLPIIFLAQCKSSSNNTETITFGYKETFKISDDEESAVVNNFIALHESIWNYQDFNLPLNKILLHEDYYIFISAAIENSEQETINQILKTEEFNFVENENSTKFSKQLLYTNNEYYIYSVIYTERVQGIPFVISWVSKDKDLITKAYQNQLFDEKIN